MCNQFLLLLNSYMMDKLYNINCKQLSHSNMPPDKQGDIINLLLQGSY